MCANTNISETVITYIRSQLTAQVPDIDSLLFADGYLDSTAMLDLILWIGDTFKIAVTNEDLVPENFATVRNISDFVQRNIPAAERQEGNATPVGYD